MKNTLAEQIADALMRAGFGADERARKSMESIIDENLGAVRGLLAALERLVDDMTEAHADELSDNHGGDGPDCSYCRNIALAQAAIVKAQGGAK